MAQPRWLAPWRGNPEARTIYHVINRVVDRRFVLGEEEREKFRMFMRMYENFTGCRVLSYCLMSNHFHLLLEVPPLPEGGLSDGELLERLRALYSEAVVKRVAEELAGWREAGDEREVARIHGRYTYRMHDLSEFMKGLGQRFTRWFNRVHERKGRLWEERFRSVIVEDGFAARTMAAYIDLNPVRAGICEDPADYRWSGYGEAVGGGKKARAGLVRALHGHEGREGTARGWSQGGVARRYRALLLGGAPEVRSSAVADEGRVIRKGMSRERVEREKEILEASDGRDLAISRVVRHRVRYFTDGVVIGSRGFVNEVFRGCRDRFGASRKDGARKPRGALGDLAGEVWSLRDLRVDPG